MTDEEKGNDIGPISDGDLPHSAAALPITKLSLLPNIQRAQCKKMLRLETDYDLNENQYDDSERERERDIYFQA